MYNFTIERTWLANQSSDPTETQQRQKHYHAGHWNNKTALAFAFLAWEQNMFHQLESFNSKVDFVPESTFWKPEMSAPPKNPLDYCFGSFFFKKTVFESSLIFHQVFADQCATSCCISDIFKHAHNTLWHFIFPLRQGHSKVTWKDRRRDSASSAAQTGIKRLGSAALLTDESCKMFSHITVSLIKAHPWVLWTERGRLVCV